VITPGSGEPLITWHAIDGEPVTVLVTVFHLVTVTVFGTVRVTVRVTVTVLVLG
jgi:hypothetical protein